MNPHGQWLIPKRLINEPLAIQEVANLTRQINPAELERRITTSISSTVMETINATTKPLEEKIQQQTETINRLQSAISNVKIPETNMIWVYLLLLIIVGMLAGILYKLH